MSKSLLIIDTPESCDEIDCKIAMRRFCPAICGDTTPYIIQGLRHKKCPLVNLTDEEFEKVMVMIGDDKNG